MNVFALCMLLLCTVEESAAQIALKPEETAAPAPVQGDHRSGAEG